MLLRSQSIRRFTVFRRSLFCVIPLLTMASAARSDWTGFRGPVADDVDAASLPLTWSASENVRWTAKLPGTGQSSPVIHGNQVFVTTVTGPQKETCHLSAWDLRKGALQWAREFPNPFPQENNNYIAKAAPTPVVDDEGVIAFFEGGLLIALTHTGEARWRRDLVAEHGAIEARHGLGSSLTQAGELVYVWIERSNEPYLAAFQKRNGELAWKVPGLGTGSWATPVILPVAGSEQLVLAGGGVMRGHNPFTGDTLWTLEGLSGNSTPSPCVVSEGLLLVGATEARGEASAGKATDSNGLIRVVPQSDGGFTAEFVWRPQRATTSFGSPIAHNGLAYFVNRSGVLFCLDLETGREVYAERTAESVWATPLAVGERVYLVGQKGATTVVAAGPEFKNLAVNRLWEASTVESNPPAPGGRSGDEPQGEIQYAVAAAPGALLIRAGETLFCLGENSAKAP